MLLMLMRHGMAEAPQAGQPDAERCLTKRGRAVLAQQTIGLARMDLQVQYLCCSAFRRARETAELIGTTLNHTSEVHAALQPGASLYDMIEVWYAAGQPERMLVVAHQPSLGEWIWQLTGAQVVMRPGSLALIEAATLQPGTGVLAGLYDPDHLAQLSST